MTVNKNLKESFFAKTRTINYSETFSLKNFGNYFSFFLKQIMNNFRTYVFCLIIPAIISTFLIYFWNDYFDIGFLTPPILLVIIGGSYLFIGFFLSLNFYELKQLNFFRRIKVLGISRSSVLIAYILIGWIIGMISIIINLALYYALAGIEINKFMLKIFSNIKWYCALELFFTYLFILSFSVTFFSFFSLTSKNKKISLPIMIFILLYAVIFGDYAITPYVAANNTGLTVLSYFAISKYTNWMLYMIASYANFDSAGLTQIFNAQSGKNFVSFSNIWIPTVITLGTWCGVTGWILLKTKFSALS